MGVSVIGKSSGGIVSDSNIRYLCNTVTTLRGNNSLFTDDAFTNYLNITGKGFLSKIIVAQNTGTIKLRVTIDGIVTCYLSSANLPALLVPLNDIYLAPSGYYEIMSPFVNDSTHYYGRNLGDSTGQTYASYPYTSGAIGACLLLRDIVFNTSCQVEIAKNTGGSTPVNFGYHIEYGVI